MDVFSCCLCNKCKYNLNWEMEKLKKFFLEKKIIYLVCGIEIRSKEIDNVYSEIGVDDIFFVDF